MKRRVCVAIAALISLLCVNAGAAFAAPVSTEKDGDRLIIKYVFYSDTISNVKVNEAKERVDYEGQKYELSDISYEKIGRRVKVTKTIDQPDKSNYPKKIEAENYEGKKVILTAEGTVNWEKIIDSPVTKIVEYTGNQTIPEKIKINKDGVYVTAKKTSSEVADKEKSFTAPAVFYGETDEDYYFNGRYVTVGESPVWQGYERDVIDYLDDRSITSIKGGSWTGKSYRRNDGKLVRNAVFYGTKQIPVSKVTYTETKGSRTHYRAEILYQDPDEDGEYIVKAKCTYLPYDDSEDGIFALKILAGAGVLVLAAAIAAGLIYLATRKRIKKEQ